MDLWWVMPAGELLSQHREGFVKRMCWREDVQQSQLYMGIPMCIWQRKGAGAASLQDQNVRSTEDSQSGNSWLRVNVNGS